MLVVKVVRRRARSIEQHIDKPFECFVDHDIWKTSQMMLPHVSYLKAYPYNVSHIS